MATSETRTRRSTKRARSRARGGNAEAPKPAGGRKAQGASWTAIAVTLALGVIVLAVTIAVFQPPILQERLAPWWAATGPALILGPLWLLIAYMVGRFLAGSHAAWRLLAGLLVTFVIATILPNAMGGMDYRGVPLESELGALLSGSTTLMAYAVVAVLGLVLLLLVAPKVAGWVMRLMASGIGLLFTAIGHGVSSAYQWFGARGEDADMYAPDETQPVVEPAASASRPVTIVTAATQTPAPPDKRRKPIITEPTLEPPVAPPDRKIDLGPTVTVNPDSPGYRRQVDIDAYNAAANGAAANGAAEPDGTPVADTPGDADQRASVTPLVPFEIRTVRDILDDAEASTISPPDDAIADEAFAYSDEDNRGDGAQDNDPEDSSYADLLEDDHAGGIGINAGALDDDQGLDELVFEGDDDEDDDVEFVAEVIDDDETDDDVEDDDEEAVGEQTQADAAAVADPAAPRTPGEILASRDPFDGLPSKRWKFPPLELFAPEPLQEIDTEIHQETAEAIEATLQEYGIEVEVAEVRPGPTVTLYGLRPGWSRRYKEVKEKNEDGITVTSRREVGRTRVKVDKIAGLDRDLALQLRASSIRIDAPIPGTNLIGVEVPNPEPLSVFMRPQLISEAFRQTRAKSILAIPLGKGSGGEAVVADMARMPHLLVAGSTGSGKSVFINSLITSLISHATPEEIRFVMVDPKRVELTVYNGIPHLITPVIVDTSKVVNALAWLVQQMERRLELLAEKGVRDITAFNDKRGTAPRMPYLVLIVDELADLMLTSGKAVEQGLVRLAQMGRATGIHLVVATQRPSVDVITGLIKANFPARASFMVTSLVDSRTILDGSGAEKLLGRGDMLYLPQDAARPIRIQSPFLSSAESDAVVAAWRAQTGGYVPPDLPDMVTPESIGLRSGGGSGSALDDAGYTNGSGRSSSSNNNNDIMEQAKALAELYSGKISTSLLQRRLGIGYPRAARLRDRLVEEGLAMAEIPNAPAETRGRGTRKPQELDD